MKWIRDLYNWILKWSDSKYGTVALVVLAFSEASFFPVPPDVLLIALALGARSKAIQYGILCSIGSVVGAIFGYHRAQLEEPSGESRFKQGETDMGDKGKKDKGKREQQKKALRNLKEKRKQNKEKKK